MALRLYLTALLYRTQSSPGGLSMDNEAQVARQLKSGPTCRSFLGLILLYKC